MASVNDLLAQSGFYQGGRQAIGMGTTTPMATPAMPTTPSVLQPQSPLISKAKAYFDKYVYPNEFSPGLLLNPTGLQMYGLRKYGVPIAKAITRDFAKAGATLGTGMGSAGVMLTKPRDFETNIQSAANANGQRPLTPDEQRALQWQDTVTKTEGMNKSYYNALGLGEKEYERLGQSNPAAEGIRQASAVGAYFMPLGGAKTGIAQIGQLATSGVMVGLGQSEDLSNWQQVLKNMGTGAGVALVFAGLLKMPAAIRALRQGTVSVNGIMQKLITKPQTQQELQAILQQAQAAQLDDVAKAKLDKDLNKWLMNRAGTIDDVKTSNVSQGLAKNADNLNSATAIAQQADNLAPATTRGVDDNLIQEARKYKSAEEFVKAQQPTKVKFISAKSSKDYMGGHEAPMAEDINAPIWDLTGKYTGNKLYPDDIYGFDSARLYSSGMDYDTTAISILKSLKNKPNAKVTVYRAIPKDIKGEINPGDWVTLVKEYAKDHGESNLGGNYKIVKKEVFARDIFTDANSIQEFGYDPQPRLAPKDTPYELLSKAYKEGKTDLHSQYQSQLTDIWNKAQGLTNKAGTVADNVIPIQPSGIQPRKQILLGQTTNVPQGLKPAPVTQTVASTSVSYGPSTNKILNEAEEFFNKYPGLENNKQPLSRAVDYISRGYPDPIKRQVKLNQLMAGISPDDPYYAVIKKLADSKSVSGLGTELSNSVPESIGRRLQNKGKRLSMWARVKKFKKPRASLGGIELFEKVDKIKTVDLSKNVDEVVNSTGLSLKSNVKVLQGQIKEASEKGIKTDPSIVNDFFDKEVAKYNTKANKEVVESIRSEVLSDFNEGAEDLWKFYLKKMEYGDIPRSWSQTNMRDPVRAQVYKDLYFEMNGHLNKKLTQAGYKDFKDLNSKISTLIDFSKHLKGANIAPANSFIQSIMDTRTLIAMAAGTSGGIPVSLGLSTASLLSRSPNVIGGTGTGLTNMGNRFVSLGKSAPYQAITSAVNKFGPFIAAKRALRPDDPKVQEAEEVINKAENDEFVNFQLDVFNQTGKYLEDTPETRAIFEQLSAQNQ